MAKYLTHLDHLLHLFAVLESRIAMVLSPAATSAHALPAPFEQERQFISKSPYPSQFLNSAHGLVDSESLSLHTLARLVRSLTPSLHRSQKTSSQPRTPFRRQPCRLHSSFTPTLSLKVTALARTSSLDNSQSRQNGRPNRSRSTESRFPHSPSK